MKYYVINSSPRKNYNTSQLLDKVTEGINDTLKDKTENVEIERVNLYDLKYTGCRSCFLCKQKDGPFSIDYFYGLPYGTPVC